ncbi:helix-turn-helix domain-containing protein [Salmonirosea aquatica]|uniref:Helix-turn-helix domain-containing protein n=1 Tax=Salmonirosea aquatica TaxID=2654236 RepID=A0A7C9BLE3_9BACT|nr:helix-turn-helix domain-containing protein [Cytophagaceae bacterium SJW1-29]
MSTPTTIQLSLPQEQLDLLEDVRTLTQRQLEFLNRTVWLTESEAAERLKISVSTLRNWRAEGWIRYFAEGNSIRYRLDYLDDDFEARSLVKAPLRVLATAASRSKPKRHLA